MCSRAASVRARVCVRGAPPPVAARSICSSVGLSLPLSLWNISTTVCICLGVLSVRVSRFFSVSLYVFISESLGVSLCPTAVLHPFLSPSRVRLGDQRQRLGMRIFRVRAGGCGSSDVHGGRGP